MSKKIEWTKNTENFAYRFTETDDGLDVEVFHRHGELIKEVLVEF